jgi:hypothetical protein
MGPILDSYGDRCTNVTNGGGVVCGKKEQKY